MLELRGIEVTYPDGTVALRNTNLQVAAGEFVSLIGPSGCGKTTLLRLAADLQKPSQGQVIVAGQSAAQARQERTYGYVFQAPTLLDWRRVWQNVSLPLEVMGVAKNQRRARALAALELVGLQDFGNSYPWQLSGGMQQRVSIARALSFDPPLLFMDEPFGALDEITREKLNLELLRIWQETGKTVLFVTHQIEEAVFLSSRVVVMSARPGQINCELAIDLPQPRDFQTRSQPRFFELVTAVRQALRAGHGFEGD